MTLFATLPPSRRLSAALRPPARPTHPAAERRRSLDLRGGQADHHRVARLRGAFHDLGEAAVADAGADLHRDEFLALVEQIDGLRLPRRALLLPHRLAESL